MSHFEYVAVAFALLNALVVGRLLGGVGSVFDRSRRYWVHAAWVVTLVLVAALQWWSFWGSRDVEWTPIRFLWVLSIPGLLFVAAGVLVGEAPGSVASFRHHFFERRVPFFSLSMASAVIIGLGPWILGQVPWFTSSPTHAVAVALMALSLAGLCLRTHTVHTALVGLGLLVAAAAFLVPVTSPAA